MAKKKKYSKLPNGFGSIKRLSGNRTNPYAIHPPTTEFGLNGTPKTPKAIAYVDDWYWGFSILLAYKAGTFVPGVYPPKPTTSDVKALNSLIETVLSDLSVIRQAATGMTEEKGPTFAEVYADYYKDKYDSENSKQYSKSARNSTRAGFKNSASLHNRPFRELNLNDLQGVVDNCKLKYASLELIVTLFKQMYRYAEPRNLCDKNYAEYVQIKTEDDDEHGVPFTLADLKLLWDNKDNETVEFILIMCYSGYRISAYKKIKIDLDELYFQGGVKNKTSKERIVPIHSAILPLVKRRIQRDGKILKRHPDYFRIDMYDKLEELGIEKHTPHDCRHTFSMLCEKYEVKENDRKRMMGHSFDDIDNKVYGHRLIEDLRTEIEKIKVCY